MPDFANAVIYKLTHDDHPSECYVGSTTQPLTQRLASHRRRAAVKPQPVHKFLNVAGWDGVHITAVEHVACEQKDQLLSRERFWISQMGTLNKNIPMRTMREYNQYYYQAHKAALTEKCRAYYQANREALCEYQRNYRARKAL